MSFLTVRRKLVAEGVIQDSSFFRPLMVKGALCALTGKAAFLFRGNVRILYLSASSTTVSSLIWLHLPL